MFFAYQEYPVRWAVMLIRDGSVGINNDIKLMMLLVLHYPDTLPV
jgi:hypothetical protein